MEETSRERTQVVYRRRMKADWTFERVEGGNVDLKEFKEVL